MVGKQNNAPSAMHRTCRHGRLGTSSQEASGALPFYWLSLGTSTSRTWGDGLPAPSAGTFPAASYLVSNVGGGGRALGLSAVQSGPSLQVQVAGALTRSPMWALGRLDG